MDRWMDGWMDGQMDVSEISGTQNFAYTVYGANRLTLMRTFNPALL